MVMLQIFLHDDIKSMKSVFATLCIVEASFTEVILVRKVSKTRIILGVSIG